MKSLRIALVASVGIVGLLHDAAAAVANWHNFLLMDARPTVRHVHSAIIPRHYYDPDSWPILIAVVHFRGEFVPRYVLVRADPRLDSTMDRR